MSTFIKFTKENFSRITQATMISVDILKSILPIYYGKFVTIEPNKMINILSADECINRLGERSPKIHDTALKKECQYCGKEIVRDDQNVWYHSLTDTYLCYEIYAEPKKEV